MKTVLVINGPNLNLLGSREPEVYGRETLDDIRSYTEEALKNKSVQLEWFQSNLEGEIVNKIHSAIENSFDGIVINPGGYSHTSVAILDALKNFKGLISEVHLSNTNRRENFRKIKITAQASDFVFEGLGKDAYYFGIFAILLKEGN